MLYKNRSKYLAGITILLIILGCYEESDYYYSSQEIVNKLKIEISDKFILADGKKTSKFTYRFPLNSDTNLTGLRLITSSGSFQESKNDTLDTNFTRLDDAENYRYIEATLVASTTVTDCIVRTQLLNYERQDTVHFTKAEPTKIKYSSNNFYAKNDTINQFNIIANVSSGTGIASTGTPVSFSFDPDVGFLNHFSIPTDTQGKAEAIFVFTDTTYTGDLQFTVETNNTEGDSFTDMGIIKIIE
ncbi:hypothetical protein [Cyclobacterium qasimii]|uniref:Uncharacterized protein n=2 Tax=Cyclobacterium qasimii TaxID=1350429 RepID=S7VR02_9BACT|nr:hypothetical protein [Cyclobacterium qasimii]EPR71782.1 hypothetical protein ADICYQ_0030 [Cyclobacterium qasimii M12-11B]GEO22168.1 hypothetical protein CQA01_27020 [Cyclobacterium qasimii]